MTTHSPVAIVTGASRGIGALLATALAEQGYAVALLARQRESLDQIVASLNDSAVAPGAMACDVTDPQAVQDVVARVVQHWGRIDVLVNNAGVIEKETPIWQADPEQWWRVVETNVRGPFLMTRAVAPVMIAQGGGRIVNMNSGAGTKDDPVLTAYTASKSALGRITAGTAEAGASSGLRAFDFAPGVVRTDMTTAMDAHVGRSEWTDPQDVRALFLALISGDLDAFSGRMVRAGTDTIEGLCEQAALGLSGTARKVRLIPWGQGDPVAR